MRPIVFTLLLSIGGAAQASPVIWHVPDRATRSVEGADIGLLSLRDAVYERKMTIAAEQSDVENARARLRDRLSDRVEARDEVRATQRETRLAIREGASDGRLIELTATRALAESRHDAADERVAWHRAEVRASRADVAHARTRTHQAVARLELRQAELLTEHDTGLSWLFAPGRFQRQKDRLDREVALQASDRQVARSMSIDQHADYVSANVWP